MLRILIGSLLVSLSVAHASAQDVLRVSTIPEEAASEQIRKFTPLVKYLERRLGMKVVFRPVSDYPAAVEALVSKQIELAWLGGLTLFRQTSALAVKSFQSFNVKRTRGFNLSLFQRLGPE